MSIEIRAAKLEERPAVCDLINLAFDAESHGPSPEDPWDDIGNSHMDPITVLRTQGFSSWTDRLRAWFTSPNGRPTSAGSVSLSASLEWSPRIPTTDAAGTCDGL